MLDTPLHFTVSFFISMIAGDRIANLTHLNKTFQSCALSRTRNENMKMSVKFFRALLIASLSGVMSALNCQEEVVFQDQHIDLPAGCACDFRVVATTDGNFFSDPKPNENAKLLLFAGESSSSTMTNVDNGKSVTLKASATEIKISFVEDSEIFETQGHVLWTMYETDVGLEPFTPANGPFIYFQEGGRVVVSNQNCDFETGNCEFSQFESVEGKKGRLLCDEIA